MFCGARSFSQIADDDDRPPPASSKSCKLKKSLSMNNSKKKKRRGSANPYSSTGLDKFERVLAELESKKKRIMLRAKPQGDATVRFTYEPNSDGWIPIIIKPRPKQPEEEDDTKKTRKRPSAPPPPMKSVEEDLEVNKELVKKEKGKVKRRRSYGWGVGCWGLVIMLVLVLLVFGRSFAVCWTAMCLYLVPMMKTNRSQGLRRDELGKMPSERKLVGGGVNELRSPKGHLSRRR